MTIRYRLSPELTDGEHWTVVDTVAQLVDAIENWADERGYKSFVGDEFRVELVDMTDEEVEALPLI